MSEISHLHLKRWPPALLDRKDRLSMAAGLEVRVPFCDHRLVEYVHNTPWDLKTPDGYPKGLLKRATRDIVPRSVLERRKSPYPTTADQLYEKDLRARTQALLAARSSPAFDVVDATGLARMLDLPQGHYHTPAAPQRPGDRAVPGPVDAGVRHRAGVTCSTAHVRTFPLNYRPTGVASRGS